MRGNAVNRRHITSDVMHYDIDLRDRYKSFVLKKKKTKPLTSMEWLIHVLLHMSVIGFLFLFLVLFLIFDFFFLLHLLNYWTDAHEQN